MAASNYYGYAYGTVAPQYSIQLPPAYSHQTTGSYSVQPAPAVAYTASFSPATAHNPQPVVSQTYQPYQTQAAPNYSFGQQEVAPQQSSTSQTYQIFSEGGICSYGQPSLVNSYENKPYYQMNDTTPQRSPLDAFFQTGVKSDYRPVSAVYSQSPAQRPATVLKALPPTSSVSTSYSVYPVSTTIQQPPSSISTFTPSSSYNSTAVTSYNCPSYSSYEPSSYISTPSYYQASQHLVPQCHSQPQGPSHHPQSSSHQPQGSSHQPPLPPQQAQTPATQLTSLSWSSSRNSSRVTGSAVSTYRKPTFHQNKVQKPKGPPKQPQLHYCDICKISCAGPQTYREHLEGQKHKKKEVLQKSSSQVTNGPHSVQIQLRCELCDVSCTGADAYKAHIRGAKHLKVVKLHTKLGKPIPSTEPIFVNSASVPMTTITAKPATAPVSSAVPQKLPFLKPPKTETPKTRVLSKTIVVAKAAAPDLVRVEEMKQAVLKSDLQNEDEGSGGGAQGNVQPVGHDYVEEICSDDGKLVRFHCKLCECSFNDPNAKDMHLKGRRHRLQYKKKVNPDLLVEIKPSNRARKLLEDKLRKQNQKAVLKRQLENEQRWHIEMRRYEEDMCWRRVEEEHLYWEEQWRRLAPPLFTNHSGMPVPPLLPVRRPDSPEDHHIMAKHASIYPADQELEAVQRIVSHSERGLKLVSDLLVEQDGKEAVGNKAELLKGRVLKGVMRVGILAKGLLLHGDRNIQLILLTAKRPTITLLNSIAQLLPKQLRTFSEDQYVVQAQPEEANIIIISSKEPKMQVTVCLTSPVMREEPEPAPGTEGKAGDKLPEKVPEDPADALNRTKCLEYLAALRHTKWFQSRANGLQSCVIIIRVLRDLCQRMPIWSKMPDWAMELLIEKALSSALTPLTPGKALRRVLECIASGILLQDGPGLIDPCEKVQTDALKTMTKQAREDVTASAQHALRLLAFRHIHKLLGMDSLPVSKASTCNRKRQRDKADEVEGEGKRNKNDF